MTTRVQPVQHTIQTPYPVGPVHSYSLLRDDGIILFDSGPDTEQARKYYQRNLDLKRLRHILITHCHIDHYGLAHWLEKESGATVYLPYRDTLKIRQNSQRLEGMYRYLRSVGFGESFVQELHGTMSSGSIFPRLPDNYFVAEEKVTEELGIKIMSCPGHSQSDLVYLIGEYAVTGDTMLEGIFQSPLLDFDIENGQRFRNYTAYCESLPKLATLEGKYIMPGHRQKVPSVLQNLSVYIDKLFKRVEPLLAFRGERDVAAIIGRIVSSKLTPFQVYLKASEVQFVLDLFEEPEVLKESLCQSGLFDSFKKEYIRVTGS
ncbi:MBL fold metallo-hydrolase [Desulfopila sp. IMCC35008]|uniref:MBL fold metallo-hydrolase n=1 Tax=Desulfopila sp. IMCC35008 TaxID=2653858 RepID=UPI0013D49C95|nr:MBL fold metallo-hydrolase [Desulfopila sp. IMCC35008]